MSNYSNPLPGVPKVESPFFKELFDEADPHYQVARDLHERGYAVIDFPEPKFALLTDRIKQDLGTRFDLPKWASQGGDLRIQDAWRFNAEVRRIAANKQIIALLSHLYGRQAFPFQTLNFPVGTEQHYHTDSVHFSAMPERFMCGVWTAFEDVGPDQGPLLYYPGSHKWPIYRNEHIGFTYSVDSMTTQKVFEPMWERVVEVHGAEPERFTPKKGQALIWAANLLHGGDRHTSRNKTRWSQVTHYFFDDCVYYTPLGSNEPAGDMLIRSPVDIVTGEPVQSSYHGTPITQFRNHPKPPDPRNTPRFDPEAYLLHNPDVKGDAFKHYVWHGLMEKRRWY